MDLPFGHHRIQQPPDILYRDYTEDHERRIMDAVLGITPSPDVPPDRPDYFGEFACDVCGNVPDTVAAHRAGRTWRDEPLHELDGFTDATIYEESV